MTGLSSQDKVQDELLARYRQASDLDGAMPGPQVRAAVLAHARAMLAVQPDAGMDPVAAEAAQQQPAANRPFWRLQALGSLAVLGLAGLLYLQFERGSEQERDLALGSGSRPVAESAPSARSPAPPLPADPVPAPAQTRAQAGPARKPAEPMAKTTAASPAPTRQTAVAAPPQAEPQALPQAEPPVVTAAPVPAPAQPQQANRAADAATAAAPPTPSAGPPPVPPAAMARREMAAAAPALAQAAPPGPGPGGRSGIGQPGRSIASVPVQASLAATLRQAAQAGDLERLELALRQGAPLEVGDEAGRTALLLAVLQGHGPVVSRLLAAGANPNTQDREGTSAVQHASRRASTEIEAMLREAGAR
jgi:hypothetical protein